MSTPGDNANQVASNAAVVDAKPKSPPKRPTPKYSPNGSVVALVDANAGKMADIEVRFTLTLPET